MKKNFQLMSSIALLVSLGLFLASCGPDDEKPAAKPVISFAESEATINEADGTIQIEVTLDKPAPERIIIDYDLEGTAYEKTDPNPNTGSYDYEVLTDLGEVKINKGETTGIIEIKFYSDGFIEADETLNISLKSADSELVEIGADDEIAITLEQEDGLLVLLEWGVGEGENYTDVDMDLFLWIEDPDNGNALALSNVSSASIGYESPEGFFLPAVLLTDGNYGLSCNYYEGTEDPMNFKVTLAPIINGEEGTITTRTGSYTAANINPWDDDTIGIDPLLAMTFKKVGTTYSDISEIQVHESGSRSITSTLPADVKRQKRITE
jgi:hypothetical protein